MTRPSSGESRRQAHGGRIVATAVGAIVATAAIELHGFHNPFQIHRSIDQGKSYSHASLPKGHILPLGLDARALLLPEAKSQYRTEDTMTVGVNPLPFGPHPHKTVTISGSGYEADIQAHLKTLVFVPATASKVSADNKTVTVDPTQVKFETYYDQSKTTFSTPLPLGTSYGSGLSNIINSATLGELSQLSDKVTGEQAQLLKFGFMDTANNAQVNCASQAWSQTEAAITEGYELEAQAQHQTVTVQYLPGKPQFVAEYPNAAAPTNLHEHTVNDETCQVSPGAFDLAKQFTTDQLSQLNPPVEAAGN